MKTKKKKKRNKYQTERAPRWFWLLVIIGSFRARPGGRHRWSWSLPCRPLLNHLLLPAAQSKKHCKCSSLADRTCNSNTNTNSNQ